MIAATAGCSSTQRVATLATRRRASSRPARAPPGWSAARPSRRSASMKRLYFILLQSRDIGRRRLGRADPALGEEAAGQRAVGQQPHPVLAAERAHLLAGAAVEQREADLVGGDPDAVLHQHAQMIGVEVGDAEMADQALLLQGRQLAHGVEIGRMLEGPPVELQQVDARRRRGGPGCAARRRARPRGVIAPGAGHHLVNRRGGAFACRARERQPHAAAGDVLGAAVVVGHVEGVEAGLGIVGHGGRRARRDRARGRRAPCRRPATGR